ncbi:MAG: 5-formyltetrahydrofolate cyclo-ligase [Treponema sp.]|nr:5-formyltetrahydrofolate cyclo-ligase [Treponema sp.]
MTKAEIRKAIKEKLSANAALIPQESKQLCKMILESDVYETAAAVAVYMALPDEADLKPIIQNALSRGKKVFIPRIFPGTNFMEFYQIETSNCVTQGSFGIQEPEPKQELSLTTFLNENQKDSAKAAPLTLLVLVPGRAFTKQGKRLGRGKGFYDIYFSKLQNAGYKNISIKKSGVCLSQQLLAELPTTPDDIKMDLVFCAAEVSN